MRVPRPSFLAPAARRITVAGLLLAATAVACTQTSSRSQVHIALASTGAGQRGAFACARECEAPSVRSAGALYSCLSRCPGIRTTEGSACDGDASNEHGICYANREEGGALGPAQRDHAARLAIAILRGLNETDPSLASLPSLSKPR